MAQVNVEIPDWLDEMASQTALRFKGKAGWKQYLYAAALMHFLSLDQEEQKQSVIAAQDYEGARKRFLAKLEAEAGGAGKHRGRRGKSSADQTG